MTKIVNPCYFIATRGKGNIPPPPPHNIIWRRTLTSGVLGAKCVTCPALFAPRARRFAPRALAQVGPHTVYVFWTISLVFRHLSHKTVYTCPCRVFEPMLILIFTFIFVHRPTSVHRLIGRIPGRIPIEQCFHILLNKHK